MYEMYKDRPNTYVLDGIITQEEAAAFMVQ
jgi:hypothetical protein